jgi:hypothetical protein
MENFGAGGYRESFISLGNGYQERHSQFYRAISKDWRNEKEEE